jgi:hypothetical protein
VEEFKGSLAIQEGCGDGDEELETDLNHVLRLSIVHSDDDQVDTRSAQYEQTADIFTLTEGFRATPGRLHGTCSANEGNDQSRHTPPQESLHGSD